MEQTDFTTNHLSNTTSTIKMDENWKEKVEAFLNSQAKATENPPSEAEVEELIKMLNLAHEKGDVEAAYYLGQFYANGYLVEKDMAKAFEWFKQAAENGYSDGINNLALCYMYGRGTEKNYEEAVEWLEKAVEADHAEAYYNLGYCYYHGYGVEKDCGVAVKFYTQAAEKGYGLAKSKLAWCYIFGIGIRQDWDKAFELFSQAVDENDEPDAMHGLSYCYRHGYGVEKDEEMAMEWDFQAAYNGHAEAQYEVAVHCERVKQENSDYGDAKEYYLASANNGYVRAKVKVGLYYFHGAGGFEKDPETAVKWFRKAAEEDDYGEAQYYLGYCYQHGLGVEEDIEEAVDWYEKAAGNGSSSAQLLLGYMYMKGEGVDEDKERALELFTALAEKDDKQAYFYLGLLYGDSSFSGSDYRQAVKWLKKAVDEGYEQAESYLDYYKQLQNAKVVAEECESKACNSAEEYYSNGMSFNAAGQFDKAAQCYTRAAEMGHVQAQYNLAICYGSGLGVQQDFQKALMWYVKSAEAGYCMSQLALAQQYEAGLGVEQDYTKAFEWYKLAEAELPMVKQRLGVFYYKGLGVKQDYAEAVRLLEEVLAMSTPTEEILSILADCYTNGLGVEEDPEKAEEYLDRIKELSYRPQNAEDDDDESEEDDDDDNGSQLLYFSQIYGEEVDFVGELENGDIDEEKVRKVEETYKVNLPEILKHMISLCTDDPENYLMCDDMNICRLLTMDEILHPKEKLDIDYISMGCVPVVDDLFGNNIVYCVEDEEWQLRDNIDESEGGSIHRRDEDVMSIIWDIWDVVDELSR